MAGYISTQPNNTTRITSIDLDYGSSVTLYYNHSDVTLYEYVKGESSDTGVATFTPGSFDDSSYIPFTVTAVGNGTATITAYTGSNNTGHRATLTVNVSGATVMVTSIAFSGTGQVYANSEHSFYATAYPSDATDRRISFSKGTGSSYYSILSTESDGSGWRVSIRTNATTVERSCSIIATAMDGSGVTKEYPFTIVPEEDPTIYVESISLSASNYSPVVGETTTIYATCSPSNAENKYVRWSVDSGAAEIPGVVGLTSITLGSNSPGTSVIRATAQDGGGATKTISITWIERVSATRIGLSGLSSMSGYDGALEVVEGQRFEFIATVYPTDTDDTLFYSESSSRFAVNVKRVGSQIGTSTYTVTVTGQSTGTGSFTLYAGSVSVTIHVTVTPETHYVEDIDFPYSYKSQFRIGENSGLVQAQSRPTDAEVRGLTYSVVSGSQLVTITNGATTDIGCRFTVVGLSAGTATVRVSAMDEGGYYEDLVFEIVEKYLSTGIQFSPSAGTFHMGRTGSGNVRGMADESVSITFVSGSEYADLSYDPDSGFFEITGKAPGTITLRAETSDSHQVATVTYNITDEWPYDETMNIVFKAGNYENHQVWHTGWTVHGGNYSVPLQDELQWGGATVILPYAESTLIQSDGHGLGPMGLATEVGTRTLFMTSPDGSETVRVILTVEYEGEWTKTIHFDANLPSGAFLSSPVPPDLVRENTGEETDIELPTQTPACEGYMFCYWDTKLVPEIVSQQGFVYPGRTVTVMGEDLELTLYAVWFPLPFGMKGSIRTAGDGINVELSIPSGVETDLDLPCTGQVEPERYPMDYHEYSQPVDGIAVMNGSTQMVSDTVMASGVLTLVGTATTPDSLMYVMLEDQRGVQVHYQILVSDGPEIPEGESGEYELDANGGTFPNGRGTARIPAPDGSYVLPDWSVVDRLGFRLTGWKGSYSGDAAMGSVQTTNETWTAQWAVDSRGYARDVLHAAVRVYRSLSEYIDLTDMFSEGGEPAIEVSEVQPGRATMTVVTDYRTQSRNIMSSRCSLWSSGSRGPVEPGMYVRIDDIGSDGSLTYLFDGFITTMSPSGEDVSIEVADWMTMLGKMGTAYRRNFYGTSRTSALFDAGYDSGGLYAMLSMPAEFSIDGTPQWKIRSDIERQGDIPASVMHGTGSGTAMYTFLVDADVIDAMSVHIGYRGDGSMSATLTVRSGQGSVSRTRTLTPSSNTYVDWEDWDMGAISLDVSGGTATVEITARGSGYLYVNYGNNGSGTLVTPDETLTNVDMAMTYGVGVWHDVEEYDNPLADGRMYIKAIEGVTDLTDTSLYNPSEDRARVPYITGSQAVGSIMESISVALGLTPMTMDAVGGDAELVMFRTGGGYALDYLQKLADTPSSLGRRRAFAVRGYTTPVIVPSSRHALSDTSSAHIHYGGDTVTGSGAVAYSAFSPSLTFKRRPNLVMVRGTMSGRGETESIPIMVAVEDTESTRRRYGLVVESVIADSSVNQALDAASSAWASLCENELDEWEGTVTLPGIRRDLLPASGQYAGSGECVLLTDSRMGIDGERARVRQLRLDYNACTTQVVLTNYNIVHSSGISDTTVMARTSADIATGDNSTTLFNTQFVRIKTDVPQEIKTTGNVVVGVLSDHTPFNFSSVNILQLPNGRSVLVAMAPADSEVHAPDDKPYDVIAVKINNGNELKIKPSVRPDYYQGQTLIINVDFPTQT